MAARRSRDSVLDREMIQKTSIWAVLYISLILYVSWRMHGFALWQLVETSRGVVVLPNTFASVDHPFHVARAETLWQALSSGQVLRWIGQHQGGYPVEFYPLGEAWVEVIIRVISFNALPAEGAHTLAVIALFLLPGVAFAALARLDAYPQSVALLALSLQIALPGGWYGGGYTELVQWGLVTNVAGATATLLALPALVAAITNHSWRAFSLASGLSAIALYSNPRSAIGLVAIGIGALVASVLAGGSVRPGAALRRLVAIAVTAALLAAPLLMSLLRFGDLYEFVHYSEYTSLTDYLSASGDSVSSIVLALGLAGMLAGLVRQQLGTRATAASASVYIAATLAVSMAPGVAALLPQLEPTRLMPLQRYLLLYLAAALVWTLISALAVRNQAVGAGVVNGILVALSIAILAFMTRPMFGDPPDPASPVVPPVSLYPVAMSAQPQQADLETAVRAADRAADPSSAILVLGSELSWHQQLWSPLWTRRPLYYDNWLWYWHVDHAGTPAYLPREGHHYPDPEATLTRDYLDQHGIGAVVTSNRLSSLADRKQFLSRIQDGSYSTYLVDNPSPIVTFENAQTKLVEAGNSTLEATSIQDSPRAVVRLNWFPRWSALDGSEAQVVRDADGAMTVSLDGSESGISLVYAVQPLDWIARAMAVIGVFVITRPMLSQLSPGRLGQTRRSPQRADG